MGGSPPCKVVLVLTLAALLLLASASRTTPNQATGKACKQRQQDDDDCDDDDVYEEKDEEEKEWPKNCIQCTGDTVSDGRCKGPCTACNPGFAPNRQHTACRVCKPGHGGKQCLPCDANSAAPGGSRKPCKPCKAGYAPNADKSACSVCAPGYGGDKCAPCTGTTVAPGGSKAACKSCPAGSLPNADRSACSVCEPGFGYDSNIKSCSQCADDTVSQGGLQATCTPCKTGFVANAAHTECPGCAAGYGRNGDNCDQCDANSASPGGNSPCTACAFGFAPNTARSACDVPVQYFTVEQAPVTTTQLGTYAWALNSVAPTPDHVSVEQLEGAVTYTYEATRTVNNIEYLLAGAIKVTHSPAAPVPAAIGDIMVTISFSDNTGQQEVQLDLAQCAPSSSHLNAGDTVSCPWTVKLSSLSAASTIVVVTPQSTADPAVTATPTTHTAQGSVSASPTTTSIAGPRQAKLMDRLSSTPTTAAGNPLVSVDDIATELFPPAAADDAIGTNPITITNTYTRPVYCGVGAVSTSPVAVSSSVALLDSTAGPLSALEVAATVSCNRPLTINQGQVGTTQHVVHSWSLDASGPASRTIVDAGTTASLTYTYQANRTTTVTYTLQGSVSITHPGTASDTAMLEGLEVLIVYTDATMEDQAAAIKLAKCTNSDGTITTSLAPGVPLNCPWQATVAAPAEATAKVTVRPSASETVSGVAVPGLPAQHVPAQPNIRSDIDSLLEDGARQARLMDTAAITAGTSASTTTAALQPGGLFPTPTQTASVVMPASSYVRTVSCSSTAAAGANTNTITSTVQLVDSAGVAVGGAAASKVLDAAVACTVRGSKELAALGFYYYYQSGSNTYTYTSEHPGTYAYVGYFARYRHYSVFNLAGIPAKNIVRASLGAWMRSYNVPAAGSLRYELREVKTGISQLTSTNSNAAAIFADLGSPSNALYGAATISSSIPYTYVEIPLSSAFVAHLSSAVTNGATQLALAGNVLLNAAYPNGWISIDRAYQGKATKLTVEYY